MNLLRYPHVYGTQDDSCSWNKCNSWSEQKDVLNVHLICHTHDDPGWIKTIDQYYYGSQKEKTATGVQYILNTVMDELEKDESKRFAWCETSFLWRWLVDYKQRNRLQKLVQQGQIEFIGGGWVQNDEAAAYYVDIIDQMTLGLRTLNKYFGDCGVPYVAWQIDPFGHSREMANLLALAKTNILTGAFYWDSYGPPPGFCFDRECLDEPIMDQDYLEEYNAIQRVNKFVEYINRQVSHQRTNHLMLLMGGDFQYTAANQWYINLDKLISLIRKNKTLSEKINIFYSTPSCYLMALKEARPKLPRKLDDFFPYASANHSYWTGFFTSRPTFKGFIRQSSALLQLVKQLQSFIMQIANNNILQNAVALAQHHDAVTGTARENVTKDYKLRLSRGWNEAEINKVFYNSAQIKKSLSAPYELLIPTTVPALGFTTFFLSNQTVIRMVEYAKHRSVQKAIKKEHAKAANTNVYIELTFDSTGQLMSLRNRKAGKTIAFRQEFLMYKGMGFSNYMNQSSGAYIFRPNGTQAEKISNVTSVQYIEGSLINETRQIIAPWISQVIRLYRGKNLIEFEWTIGPIPKELKNPITKEIITRYTTDINSTGIFYTDSNGRQMMKRTTNCYPSFSYTNTEPIAGNYYPVNSRIYIRDSINQLTVLTDRSHGGTSLNDGQIELMLHRRSFYDDNFGVGEALDELGDTGQGLVVRGRHWIIMESPEDSAKLHRPLAFELYNSPLITFAKRKMAPSDYGQKFITEYSALKRPLPLAINILTMEMIAPKHIIIRLEHIFQGDDDKNLAQPIEINLNGLFTAFDIVSIEQLNLATMRKRTLNRSAQNNPFRLDQNSRRISQKVIGKKKLKERNEMEHVFELFVSLQPMEILTFEAEIRPIKKT
ncbi:unnamed protein product [Acanthocheilonema viteae]|uniref:alpha-mannosidase n=1 Tax=Acanthocheilonema viteae TaxID=6277 RepID=A0A498S2A8_ACAVI|nr:unnamed protein product [Acanthocheilonema viteae]